MVQREKAELELPSPADSLHEPERADLLDRLIVLVKWKLLIFTIVFVSAILAIVMAWRTPNQYTAVTKIMPPQQGQSMAAAVLNQLGPLAAFAGGGGALKGPSDIYITMLRSRTVEDDLIKQFALMDVYKAKLQIQAENRLAGSTEISAGKDGVLSISVEDLDPQRAADLANAYVDELTKLSKTLALTEASKRRKFFELQMNDANQQLADSELAMKQMQEKTGIVMFDSQSRSMIQTLATLKAQVAAKEVQVQSMQSFATAENPDLVRSQQELAALRLQVSRLEGHSEFATDLPIEKVPTAGLDYLRKYREVKYHEALFELLARQYEAARIDEGRDAVLVQQLDKAVPPEIKSGPHRGTNVVVVTILSFFFAVLVAFLVEAAEQSKDDPHVQSRLQLFRFYLRWRRQS